MVQDAINLAATADSSDAFLDDVEPGASPDALNVLGEMRVAIGAARRVQAAAATEDALAAYSFLRVVLESAIRLRWLAGNGTELVPGDIHERINRQRRRDVTRFRDALTLMPESVNRSDTIQILEAELISLKDTALAPGQLRDLADTPDAKLLYDAHRFCSTLIHPGAAIRLVAGVEAKHAVPMANSALDRAMKLAAACTGVLDRDEPRPVDW